MLSAKEPLIKWLRGQPERLITANYGVMRNYAFWRKMT
jgi:hypothetical protein